VDLDQSDPGVLSSTQSLLALLLLLLLLGGDTGVDGRTATVERGRSPERESLFGERFCDRSDGNVIKTFLFVVGFVE
jgi:hypothetical protein